MSYYLKYRPQKTAELDIAVVRDFYASILKSGKFSHAYLFSGPRGTGKTSAARIFAKLVNCEKNTQAILEKKSLEEPCGVCAMCQRITHGSSLSVIEIDAASNRGIDDIRALREKIRLSPAEGTYVVYIIDEVHMLTTEAFNALLKTLEEPPLHAIFALCTTELHKLPETVVSRCTQVVYPKATVLEVKQSLSKAILGEKLTISDQALTLLAESVDGSFRDGMKILEQLASTNPSITNEMVTQFVHLTNQYDPKPFVDELIVKDIKGALKVLAKAENNGVDAMIFSKRILEMLRERLFASMATRQTATVDLMRLTELMAESTVQIKIALIPFLPLELLAAKWCFEGDSQSVKITSVKAGTSQNDNLKNQTVKNTSQRDVIKSQTSSVKNQTIEAKDRNTTEKRTYNERELKLEEVLGKWGEILAGVKPLNHSLEALLKSSKPLEVNGSEVTVGVFYKFHKDRLEEEKHRSAIESVMGSVLTSKVRLQFVLTDVSEQKPVTSLSKSKPLSDDALVKAAEEAFG